PHTDWNEEAKSLIREGYGLIATASQPTSSFIDDDDDDDDNNYYQHTTDNNPQSHQQQQQQRDTARTIARTSILDLLPSVSTSASRHFLLAFLPHFMPLALLNRNGGGNEDRDCVPLWLRDDDGEEDQGMMMMDQQPRNQCHNFLSQSSELVNNAIMKILEAFQSLIQTDVSTLVPFLSTLSIIFEHLPDDGDGDNTQLVVVDTGSSQKPCNNDDAHVKLSSSTATNNNARSKCFHLCLSSLPSISEYDLPSLLHSLFTLVRNEEEGRVAMQAVRTEWTSVCRSDSASAEMTTEGASHGTNNNTIHNNSGDNLVLFIGNVIIQSILSEQTPGSRHLGNGFVDTLRNSLHIIQDSSPTDDHDDNSYKDADECPSPLTSLDAIVLIALYSNPDYQRSVESIFDAMALDQTLAFIKLMQPLIQSWLPSTNMSRWSERERTNSLLYEPLASPLISVLFYIMISSSSLVKKDGHIVSALMGGLLPFHTESISHAVKNAAVTNASASYMIANACCRVFSELFSAVDPQRQEQIINSLLPMVSDSFVRSTPSDFPGKRNLKRHWQQGSNATMAKERQRHQVILLEAACSACRTLLLITNNHASGLSQIRGVVLDRLLLLASMSVSTTKSTETIKENEEVIAYHLFDMNCAILISLLQDTHQVANHVGEEGGTAHHSTTTADGSGGSSELLILCQKLLFSANFMSTATSIADNSYQHRAICGLILASRLLRCKLIPSGERGSIWSWVLTVISPSSSAATPLEALDPEIARWGLAFLQCASSIIPSNMLKVASSGDWDPIEMAPFVDTQSVCGQSDVFNQVNKMLATAAIVQIEDSLRVPLLYTPTQNKEFSSAPLTFLAFADVSTHDHLRKKKSPPTTSMVICASYFLHGTLMENVCLPGQNKPLSTPINVVADYVYDLVDRYLELGTSKSESWNPRGWLLAKIQLPCCLSRSAMEILGMEKHYGLEVDADLEGTTSVNFDLDANDDNFQSRLKLLFADETKPKATIVQNLFEFARCIIISISVSCAVLKHAYRHFEREEAQLLAVGNNGASASSHSAPEKLEGAIRLRRRKRKQLEALRKLLQFQVNKVHTMQRICRNVYLALNRLHAEVCKLNVARTNLVGNRLKKEGVSKGSASEHIPADVAVPRQNGGSRTRCEDKASYEKRQIPLSEVKSTVTAMEIFLTSAINNIDNSILWSCVEDDADDGVLLENLGNTKSRGNDRKVTCSSFPMALRIIRLRRIILRYLQHNIIQLNNEKTGYLVPHSEGKLHALSLSGISRIFCMTVSLTPCLNDFNKLTDCAFSLIILGGKGDKGNAEVGVFLSAHYKLLLAVFSFATKGSALRLSMKDNVLLPAIRKKSPGPEKSVNNLSCFTGIIQKCAELISSAESKPPDLGGCLTSSSFSALTETLSENLFRQLKHCEDASISCHIIDLLSIVFVHTNCSRGVLAEITSGALHSVYTSSTGKGNLPYTLFIMNDILTKATDEEHESDRSSIVKESFASLIRTSNALLKAKDSFTVAFVHHVLAHWSALILEGASQFRCLTEMVEAVDAYLSTSFGRPNKKYSSPPCKKNPLPGLNGKTYTSLFELLLHMINTSLALSKPCCKKKERTSKAYQIEGPYEETSWPWKVYGKLLFIFQSNHVFFPRRFALTVVKSSLLMTRLSDYQILQCVQWRNSQHSLNGMGNDSAAVEFLQPLIDNVASHCIGNIISFCNAMKVQQNDSERSWGSSYKHTKAISGLLFQCEGFKDTLQNICLSQGLNYPKDFTPHQITKGAPKRKKGHCDDKVVKKKMRGGNREFSPQGNIWSLGPSDKIQASPSVLELLPESGKSIGPRFEYINDNSSHQSGSEKSHLSDDVDSIFGSLDDDSFGAIGDWAT
ncbi:hypothetical protein ACHAXR_010064, partial [Thalassiosira sp. AJA248-18]